MELVELVEILGGHKTAMDSKNLRTPSAVRAVLGSADCTFCQIKLLATNFV